MAKVAFQKLNKVIRQKKSLGRKKRVRNCYIISILVYDSEFWTIHSQMNIFQNSMEEY